MGRRGRVGGVVWLVGVMSLTSSCEHSVNPSVFSNGILVPVHVP